MMYASKVRALCIMCHIWSCLAFGRSWMFGLGIAFEGETFLPSQPSLHSGIRLVSGNMFMVAIDMYEKSPLWE